MQETKVFQMPDGIEVPVETNRRAGNKIGVMMLHGFTSSIHTHIWYNAANSWPAKSFDTWRVPLYPGGKNQRRMRTIRWKQNMDDIKKVLAAMQKIYKKVFIIGHSMGGNMAVYAANPKVAGIVLWDPAYNDRITNIAGKELHKDYYTLDWGVMILTPKTYGHELERATLFNGQFAKVPTLLVRAANNTEGWDFKKVPAKHIVIPGSDHSFHKEGNEKELFKQTLKFIKTL